MLQVRCRRTLITLGTGRLIPVRHTARVGKAETSFGRCMHID